MTVDQGNPRFTQAHRKDTAFPHTAYLEELTALRSQLAHALSNTATADAAPPPVADLVASITALHATHTLDASPARPAAIRATTTVAEAITARLRQQTPTPPAPVRPPEAPPLVLMPVTAPAPRPATPRARRQSTPRPGRHAPQQLRLW